MRERMSMFRTMNVDFARPAYRLNVLPLCNGMIDAIRGPTRPLFDRRTDGAATNDFSSLNDKSGEMARDGDWVRPATALVIAQHLAALLLSRHLGAVGQPPTLSY